MATFARVESGTVKEVVDVPSIEGRYHESLQWVPCGPEVAQGWEYTGGVFVPPAGE